MGQKPLRTPSIQGDDANPQRHMKRRRQGGRAECGQRWLSAMSLGTYLQMKKVGCCQHLPLASEGYFFPLLAMETPLAQA